MTGKLIRYHFLWMAKMPTYYAAFALFAVAADRLALALPQSTVVRVIGSVFFSLTIAMAVSSLINVLIRSWARFLHYSYKDESYLLHTLPVKRDTLYLSHLASSLIGVTLSVAFLILCLFLLAVGTDMMEWIRAFLNMPEGVRNFILAGVTVFLEMIFLLLCGIAGVTLGYSTDGARTLKSVLISAGLYFVGGLLALGTLALFGAADPEIRAAFAANGTMPPAFWKMALVIDSFYLVASAALGWIGLRLYRTKINVD